MANYKIDIFDINDKKFEKKNVNEKFYTIVLCIFFNYGKKFVGWTFKNVEFCE